MLAQEGGLYTFEDVLEAIKKGQMQSFTLGDTWVITTLYSYPRKKVLHILYVIGAMGDLVKMESEVIDFAKSHGAEMITANGRLGWLKRHFPGWQGTAVCWRKEI